MPEALPPLIADPKAKGKYCILSNIGHLGCSTHSYMLQRYEKTTCKQYCNLLLIANCILISEMLKCEKKVHLRIDDEELILQTRKLKFREAGYCGHNHRAGERQSWVLNASCPPPFQRFEAFFSE